MFQITKAQPTVCFLDRHTVQAQIAHLCPQFTREPVFTLHLLRQRHDLFLGKAPGGVAGLVSHFAKLEIKLRGRDPVRSFAMLFCRAVLRFGAICVTYVTDLPSAASQIRVDSCVRDGTISILRRPCPPAIARPCSMTLPARSFSPLMQRKPTA